MPVALMVTRARTSNSSLAFEVARPDAGDGGAVVEERGDLDGGDAAGALRGGRAGERHGEARVVHLRVVVADAAGERVVA